MFSQNPFFQIAAAALLAAVTGAGGGIVARCIGNLTFNFWKREPLHTVLRQALRQYVQLAFGVGILSYLALRAVTSLLAPKNVTAEMFMSASLDPAAFERWDQWFSSETATTAANLIIGTNVGLTLGMSFAAGFGACYALRNTK